MLIIYDILSALGYCHNLKNVLLFLCCKICLDWDQFNCTLLLLCFTNCFYCLHHLQVAVILSDNVRLNFDKYKTLMNSSHSISTHDLLIFTLVCVFSKTWKTPSICVSLLWSIFVLNVPFFKHKKKKKLIAEWVENIQTCLQLSLWSGGLYNLYFKKLGYNTLTIIKIWFILYF